MLLVRLILLFLPPKHITTAWFFAEPPKVLKTLGIYVKGDALVLLPFLILLPLTFLISIRFGAAATGLFFALRGLGEMIYWLLQQFGPKTYRPWDYGMKNLSNEGVYIVYQLTSLLQITVASGVVLYTFYFWNTI